MAIEAIETRGVGLSTDMTRAGLMRGHRLPGTGKVICEQEARIAAFASRGSTLGGTPHSQRATSGAVEAAAVVERLRDAAALLPLEPLASWCGWCREAVRS